MRFRVLRILCTAISFLYLAGCNRSIETQAQRDGAAETGGVPIVADDSQVVAAIEATEGVRIRRSATHIVELDLRDLAPEANRSLVEEFAWTRSLPGLQTLVARGPGISDEAVAQLTGHPSLSVLKFEASTELSDAGVAVAADLPRLSDILMDDAAITDESLKRLSQSDTIRRLRLPRTQITDRGVKYLLAASQLELVDLVDCEGVSDASLAAIGQLPQLRNLRVSGSQITDQGVGHLSGLGSLAALGLQQTAVTDDGVAKLTALERLKEINLYGTPVTDAALAPLAKLPRLEKARLRQTQVRGENAASFAEMRALRELDLSECPVQDAALEPIGQIAGLRSLNLWLTEVTDAGIEQLRELENLESLNLDNVSGITDASLDTIGQMSKLKLLHLGGTSITDAGLPKLYELKDLRTLFITRTEVSQRAYEELKEKMPWLERIEY